MDTANMESDELSQPPLPLMKWENDRWTAPITLSAWASFEDIFSFYGIERPAYANEEVKLNVYTPDFERNMPSIEQLAAYDYLLEHQIAIRDAILNEFFKVYPEWRVAYGYPDDRVEEFMPTLENPFDLSKIIALSYIVIHSIAKNGIAYRGFGFECTWDPEHGAGALTHRNRVVEVGLDESAYMEFAAENDRDQNK